MRNSRRNQNLTPDEAARLRAIAAYHGYKQSRGRGAKEQGSVLGLTLAVVDGEVATVQIDHDELRPLIDWLRAQAETQRDVPIGETITSLADQLAATLPKACDA